MQCQCHHERCDRSDICESHGNYEINIVRCTTDKRRLPWCRAVSTMMRFM